MTLSPAFSAESEMEGWVDGGCSEERLTERKVERQAYRVKR